MSKISIHQALTAAAQYFSGWPSPVGRTMHGSLLRERRYLAGSRVVAGV